MTKTLSPDPRNLAIVAFSQICDQGHSLDAALKPIYDAPLAERDRAFARELLMVMLRHHGDLDALLASRLQKPLTGALRTLHVLLMLGAAQLKWLGTPPHAAIDTSVRLARAMGFDRQSGLVNAVLRRISEDKNFRPAAERNIPTWLQQSWRAAYGETIAKDIAAAQLLPAPLDIVVRSDPQGWAQRLGAEVISGNCIRLAHAPVNSLQGYDEGGWWVQDVAASLPVRLLGNVAGKKVADVCAAPGGKTAQLASAGAQVVALDRSARRMRRLQENLDRLALNAELVTSDVLSWRPRAPIDAVLLDAPCSATGTMRRHPDMLLQKTRTDMSELLQMQRQFLDHVAGWLAPSGLLVYAVCSLQPEEGEAQIEAFLRRHPAMALMPIDAAAVGFAPEWVTPRGMMRTLPYFMQDKGGMDGFFAAVMQKKPV